MSYRVIKAFTDIQDDLHPYEVGDVYPRDGVVVLQSRANELLSKHNRRGEQLIEEVDDGEDKPTKPKKKASK